MEENATIMNEQVPQDEHHPHWILAKQGIHLLLNNNGKAAQELFLKYPDSLVMLAGYSFTVFLDALMTFEDDKIALATAVLKDVEKRCTGALMAMSSKNWLKTMKNKVFTANNNNNAAATASSIATPEAIPVAASSIDHLETQIILADSQVCLAMLGFLQQDIASYFKGGWGLRKSWKIYQSVYMELSRIDGDVDKSCFKMMDDDISSPEYNISSSAAESSTSSSAATATNSPKDSNGYCNNNRNYCNIKTSPHRSTSAILNNNEPQEQQHTNNNISPSSSLLQLKKSQSVYSALSASTINKNNWSSKFTFISSRMSTYFTSSTFNLLSPLTTVTPTTTAKTATTARGKFRSNYSSGIDQATIKRLMSAVSFGYGLFQLGVSLLPPSLLKLTSFLGFGGNRRNAIACLMYSREGVDMRAPLATLALLWYHTIVRPFYALDGGNIQAGVDSTAALLLECDAHFKDSALFLFFKGRVSRLNSNISDALASFQLSVDNATQRELKILSLHEVGWCYLIELDYGAARTTFNNLQSWSRWSKGFYQYLTRICHGCCSHHDSNNEQNTNDSATTTNDNNCGVDAGGAHQLDNFLRKRNAILMNSNNNNRTACYWRLFVYEMLYLWNALPSCSASNIRKIREDCMKIGIDNDDNVVAAEPMLGLSQLIYGCCCCIEMDNASGLDAFRECLRQRKDLPNNAPDAHLSAFAQYELAILLIKADDTKEEGKVLLQQISQYKDYDFDMRLNVRVHSILKHL